MRTLLVPGLVVFLLLMGCKNNSNLSEVVMPVGSLDSTNVKQWVVNILNGLPDKDTTWILWQPNTEEAERIDPNRFFLDDKGNTHARIDSSFQFSYRGKQFLVQLFSSYGFSNDHDEDASINKCHPCAPVLGAILFEVEKDGRLGLVKQNKLMQTYGTFGYGGIVHLINYGNKKGLMVESSWTGQGNFDIYATLYDCFELNEIFHYGSLESYDGSWKEEDSASYNRSCKILLKEQDGYILLDLVCSGTQPDSAYKIIRADSTYYYYFDEAKRKFIAK